MLNVTHFHRKPKSDSYSLERVFADIRNVIPIDINVVIRESRFDSRGLWRRAYNIVEAALRQGDINHITGDVHFLTYLLKRQCTVLTILDCVSLERLRGIKRWALRLLWYVLPVHFVDTITVISTATKQELLKVVNCNPDKIKVIYCPVSACFVPDERCFNADYPRILQIGTGVHNKNIARVATALAGINCRWVIIGHLSVEQLADIARYSLDYENHIDLSNDALLEEYKLADMLVFASTYEGFGLPIVEANAVGRPVVTSNLYSMPEVAGEAACLVDPYDVVSIRAGILRLIREPEYRDTLVKAGFKNVERFRARAIAEQYAQLYRKIGNKS